MTRTTCGGVHCRAGVLAGNRVSSRSALPGASTVRVTWLAVMSIRNRVWAQQPGPSHAQRGHGGDHLGTGREGEPGGVAGVLHRRSGGSGHLPPLADPGSQRVVAQRAALGPGGLG